MLAVDPHRSAPHARFGGRYFKAELIYGPARTGPWKTIEDVELATLGWVYWHNTSRLHGYLGDLTPAEFEAAFYDAQRSDQPLVEIQ